jgi:hypothetical protein
MVYIDENGNRYELVLEPGYKVWYVARFEPTGAHSRFGAVPGSKDYDRAAARLNKYALATGLVIYPDVICDDCAERIGKRMAEGHIATWYPAICGVCNKLVSCSEPRDWGHFSRPEELKALYRVAKEGG